MLPTTLTRLARSTAKDTLSLFRQTLGLPHDRTRAQVKRVKRAYTDVAIAEERVRSISQACGVTETDVEEAIGAFSNQREMERNAADCGGQSQDWAKVDKGLMSLRDQMTLFGLVHCMRPAICVETGASGGASTTATLTATESNASSHVHSVDLACAVSNDFGELIPQDQRDRWTLHLQSNEPVLPKLLTDLGEIDFFLHDSNHTWRHMTWEYETAWPHVKSGGCLASHDIVVSTAFDTFVKRHADEIAAVGRVANFGFCIKS